MIERLRFHPQVALELSEAIAWYEQKSNGLGDRFRAAVDVGFDRFLDNPELYPCALNDADIRFLRLRRFPYLSLFRLHRDMVPILGVFHSASDPAKWRLRASEQQ